MGGEPAPFHEPIFRIDFGNLDPCSVLHNA